MPAAEGDACPKADKDPGWSEQRLELAIKTKEKGNTAYKANDWEGAAELYDKAYKLCKASCDVPRVRTVLLACLTNRALTLSKLERHEDVVTTCSAALGLDPENDKALYRRGVARSKLGMFDQAEDDLNKLLAINPKSSEAKTGLKDCAKLRKQEQSKSPKSRPFEGMFNRSSPDKQQLANRFSNLSCEDANQSSSRVCPYGGLKNEGATCYLNSVLQTIFHLPIFRRAVYSIPTNPARPGEKISVALALQRLFCRLQSPSSRSKAVSGVELLASFGWDSNDMLMQQDVGEFLNVFFDRIEASMKRDPELKDTIQDLFGLKLACIDTIEKPKSEAEKAWIRYRDDPASFPLVISEIREYNNISAVCEFKAEPEKLTGVNTSSDYEDAEKAVAKAREAGDPAKLEVAEEELKRVLASTSGKGFGYCDLARRSLFGKMPPILMVNLTRIGYCPVRGIPIKINSRFEFEENLDLTAYCREGTFERDDPPKYRLYSVIVHSGFSQVGHYYCFLRPKMRAGTSGDDQWYKFDDDAVWPCTREEAVHANYGEDVGVGRMRSAYFLVYIRESEVDKVLDTAGLSESIPKHVVESMGDEGLTSLPQALCVLLPRGRGAIVGRGKGATKAKGNGTSKKEEGEDGARLRGAVVQVAVPDMQNCSIESLVALVKQACADAQHPGIEPPSTEEWFGGFPPPLYERVIDEDGEENVRAVLDGDGDTAFEPELHLCLTLLRNYEIANILDSTSNLPLSKLNLNMAMRLEWLDLSATSYYTRVSHVMLLPGGQSRRHGDPFLLNAYYGEPVLTIKRRLCVTMGLDWEDVSQWEFYWLSNRPDDNGQWEVTDDEPLVDTNQEFLLRACQLVVVHPASEDGPLVRDFWAPSILNKQNEATGIRIQSDAST